MSTLITFDTKENEMKTINLLSELAPSGVRKWAKIWANRENATVLTLKYEGGRIETFRKHGSRWFMD